MPIRQAKACRSHMSHSTINEGVENKCLKTVMEKRERAYTQSSSDFELRIEFIGKITVCTIIRTK